MNEVIASDEQQGAAWEWTAIDQENVRIGSHVYYLGPAAMHIIGQHNAALKAQKLDYAAWRLAVNESHRKELEAQQQDTERLIEAAKDVLPFLQASYRVGLQAAIDAAMSREPRNEAQQQDTERLVNAAEAMLAELRRYHSLGFAYGNEYRELEQAIAAMKREGK